MPPKKKKPLKKSKLKNVVSVKKPRVKPSVKPRVELIKALPQQPFVNFPSYQPTRIQQLEPKQQFNNADLTKTIDEIYQKQFKVYMETQNKDIKKMIEDNDDSLKTNIALSQKDTWTNPNEINQNQILETKIDNMPSNNLFNRPRTYLNLEEDTSKPSSSSIDVSELQEIDRKREYDKLYQQNEKYKKEVLQKYDKEIDPIKKNIIISESAIKKTKSENIKLKNEKILKENNEKLKVIESKRDTELNLLKRDFKALIQEKGLSKKKPTRILYIDETEEEV